MIIENDKLKVSLKAEGAEMTSINYLGKEYLWNGDKKYWGRHAPILFPIVGKLRDNKTQIDGVEYEMGQHGFARDSDFEVVSLTSTSVCFRLYENEETLKKYPYHFELLVSYEINDNCIKVTYNVINKDKKIMFFSIGGHPAFCWPIEKGESFEDYEIKFSQKENASLIAVDEGYVYETNTPFLVEDDTIELSKKLFDVDTLIFRNLNSDSVTYKSKKSDSAVKFHFSGFPYLGIWSGKGDAPFICLEPWYGIADEKGSKGVFEEKLGINKLVQNEQFTCSYTIEVR